MSGFETATTDTLIAIRSNLLTGLERVEQAIADGTFTTVGPKGSAPPSQSGQTTLALLIALDEEIATRANR